MRKTTTTIVEHIDNLQHLSVLFILFFVYNIPSVIGDLTGATARKAIENIRNQNESSGDKTYKSSAVNRERGKITDKISPSGRLLKAPSDQLTGAMATAKISTQELPPADETDVLGSNETTVLGGNETTVLGGNETTVLGGNNAPAPGGGETTVLSADNTVGETSVLTADPAPAVFQIEYEITYIHTDEVIA